jgi:hypothetical protein
LDKIQMPNASFYAIVNSAVKSAPWPYSAKHNQNPGSGQWPAGSFFEGGIDLAGIAGENTCFTSFLVETRQSQAVDAALGDFILGNVQSKPIISVAGASVVCSGQSITLTATVSGGVGPFSCVWSTGDTTPSIVVTEPGAYTVDVSGANGCVGSSSATVESSVQCVTRDAAYWFSHIVPPPRINLGPGVSPATLQTVFQLLPNGLVNMGFIQATLDQALGLFYGNPVATGEGGISEICADRKRLSVELIAAIANTKLLNVDSSRCGVQDPNTGDFIVIDTLIQEAQAATQVEPNVFDCTTSTAWSNQMAYLTSLLNIYNAGGVALPVSANLADTGIGTVNVNYILSNQVDPTTAANCGCPNN